MRDLNLEALVDFDHLLERLAQEGATLIWSDPAAKRPPRLQLDVIVDAEEAFEAIPNHWFKDDDETHVVPEDRDVRDFVEACVRGDHRIATALVSRLIGPASAQNAAERALRSCGRARL